MEFELYGFDKSSRMNSKLNDHFQNKQSLLKLLIVLLVAICSTSLYSQEPISKRETSHTLQALETFQEIVSQYRPNEVLNYDKAREVMYTEIYNVNDTITCMYTGYKLPLSHADKNPIGHLMKFNPLKSIIAEHSYPKSKGAKEGKAKSDMHHLFPVRLGVNVARYNHPFALISEEDCTAWFSADTRTTDLPKDAHHNYAQKSNGQFAPRDDFKGNVARAVFYFYTIYRKEAVSADSNFFELQRQTLLEWHKQDPVDALELQRTYRIAQYQDGKANPFVLDETLATTLYASSK